MRRVFKPAATGLAMMFLLGSLLTAQAFALLGPYESWMETTNGLRQSQTYEYDPLFLNPTVITALDIGGPMDIGSDYRWNVPVITYGFDQSFLDYFGTNGVAAVKSAIRVFNDLPPASKIVLTNFPLSVETLNYPVLALTNAWFYDLKSHTLSLLAEQLGLSQPIRYCFVIKQWDPSLMVVPNGYAYSGEYCWGSWAIPQFIVRRNFDPETLEQNSIVNDIIYTAIIWPAGSTNYMLPLTTDLNATTRFSVADFGLNIGRYYTGLSRDDVGGLRYLLSTNTIHFETLLPDVRRLAASEKLVDGAWRPGVDKITFVEQPTDARTGQFRTYAYRFTDHYYRPNFPGSFGGKEALLSQPLERVVTKPDILFCVADSGAQWPVPQATCTGTTNWINNAKLNGNSTSAGPGVIRPGIRIAFDKSGETWTDWLGKSVPWQWASFDASTNPPVFYPVSQP
jgi:hypothetical protein